MRKSSKLLVLLAIVLVFSLSACSSESKSDNDEVIVEVPIELKIKIQDESILVNSSTSMEFETKGNIDVSQIVCEPSNDRTAKIEGKNIIGLEFGTTNIVCKYDNISSNSISISVEEPIVEEPVKKNMSLISITSPVNAGANLTIKIKGLANTEYSIYVYYNSGISEASGLQDKTSGTDGKVNWTWKVGARTTPGTYRIVVAGGDESFEVPFVVR